MKRKLLALVLACVMMTSSASYAMGVGDAQIPLSQLTEEECVAFIVSQGLSIPKELKNYENLGKFVKDIIVEVENNPGAIFAYNYSVTLEFTGDIKAIVNAYYGNSNMRSVVNDSYDFYDLVDSETVGVWDEIFTEYNCYAYTLGYTSSPNNSYFAPYPGFFSPYPELFNILDTVDKWSDLTVIDLKETGYSCVYKTTDYSDIMDYSNTHTIICLRKGDHPDYHYMRLGTSSWYHKPGNTHLLRYLTYRPDIKNWTNECSFRGVDYPPDEGKYYAGTIYYFAFRPNHNLGIATPTGNDYHEGQRHYYEYYSICQDCGEYAYHWESEICLGPPCEVIMGIVDTEEVIK